MPAIHLGGDGWAQVRLWPESQPHQRWQHHLRSLLRGPVLCRQWVMHCDAGPLRNADLDWGHPGVGKATTPSWERSASKARGASLGSFEIGHCHVTFTATGNGRRATASATTASVVDAARQTSGCRYELVLDQPVKVCVENAALLVLLCEALALAARAVAELPAVDPEISAAAAADAAPEADDGLKQSLAFLEPFQSKVLELICGGWTNAEIASATRMSLSSVRAATSVIYERLGVRNRHEAAALCGSAFARPQRGR